MDDLMDNTSYGRAARLKFGAVPDCFHVFNAEWIGERPGDWTHMRVMGAEFEGSKRLPGTTMVTMVTRAEMDACREPPNLISSAHVSA